MKISSIFSNTKLYIGVIALSCLIVSIPSVNARINNISSGGTITVGSTIFSGGTQGSVFFAGSGGTLSQNNSQLFWDNTNNRLGVGTSTPSSMLTVAGKISIATTTTGGLTVGDGTTGSVTVGDASLSKANGSLWSITGVNLGGGNAGVVSASFGAINTGWFGTSNSISGSLAGTEKFTFTIRGLGIGTTTPNSDLQVATTTANATTTVTIGKAGQTKGSCLELYDAGGAVKYVFIASGTTAFTIQTTSCK